MEIIALSLHDCNDNNVMQSTDSNMSCCFDISGGGGGGGPLTSTHPYIFISGGLIIYIF